MSYSFTEKKRIRKSFAKRPSVLEVPSLLERQMFPLQSAVMKVCRVHLNPSSLSSATTV